MPATRTLKYNGRSKYGEIKFVDQSSKTNIHNHANTLIIISAHIYQIIKGDVRSDGALLKKHAMKYVVLLPSIDETTDKNNLINRSMARIDTKTNTNATKTKAAGVNMLKIRGNNNNISN